MLHGKRLAGNSQVLWSQLQRWGLNDVEVGALKLKSRDLKQIGGKKLLSCCRVFLCHEQIFMSGVLQKASQTACSWVFFPVLKLLKKHIHFSFHDSKATFLKASWFQTQSDTAKCWVAVKNWWTWTLGKLGKVNRLVNMKTKEDMCTAMYELNQQKNHSRVQWSHLEPKNSTHGMHSWHQKLVRIVRASRSFKLWGTYALVRMGREISWLCEIPRRGGCQLLLLFWKKCFVRLSLFKF